MRLVENRSDFRLATMITAALPDNESERLQALRALLILDTPPEQRFDRIVQFAADEFDVPIALISLVDDKRQWFKARVGMAACETGRDIAFCSHALHSAKLLMVEDALLDQRFFDNPLVAGDPRIRFYAGAPLWMPSSLVIGTLCVIDTRPRHFDAVDRSILEALRDLTVAELHGENPQF